MRNLNRECQRILYNEGVKKLEELGRKIVSGMEGRIL